MKNYIGKIFKKSIVFKNPPELFVRAEGCANNIDLILRRLMPIDQILFSVFERLRNASFVSEMTTAMKIRTKPI